MTNRKPFLLKMGRRIREIREKQRLSAAKVAELADVEASFISKLENGLVWVGPESLDRIAKALGVAPGDLMPSEVRVESLNLGLHRVPVLNRVHVSEWEDVVAGRSFATDIEYARVNTDRGPRAFALYVEDKSMEPKFDPGDLIIVDPSHPKEAGAFVVAGILKDTWVLRQYKIESYKQSEFRLAPLNDSFPTVSSTELNINILGTVVERHIFLSK